MSIGRRSAVIAGMRSKRDSTAHTGAGKEIPVPYCLLLLLLVSRVGSGSGTSRQHPVWTSLGHHISDASSHGLHLLLLLHCSLLEHHLLISPSKLLIGIKVRLGLHRDRDWDGNLMMRVSMSKKLVELWIKWSRIRRRRPRGLRGLRTVRGQMMILGERWPWIKLRIRILVVVIVILCASKA